MAQPTLCHLHAGGHILMSSKNSKPVVARGDSGLSIGLASKISFLPNSAPMSCPILTHSYSPLSLVPPIPVLSHRKPFGKV